MTPDQLRLLVSSLPAVAGRLDDEPPEQLLRALEELAEAHPGDEDLELAISEVHGQVTADRGLPPVVAGVRREVLVRWDPYSTTWEGISVDDGDPAQVRVLRPTWLDDPARVRALIRAGRALSRVREDLVVQARPHPALAGRCPGVPLGSGPPEGGARLVRMFGTGLAALTHWQRAGLSPPVLSDHELRHHPGGLAVSCLSLAPRATFRDNVRSLALRLQQAEPGSSVAEAISGLAHLPPQSADEAVAAVLAAMAQDLAATRHDLARRAAVVRHRDLQTRLHQVIVRLERAVPPPEGRGAVGVDLEGRVTGVFGTRDHIAWGPMDSPRELWSAASGFDAPWARRLLRARATSPPNPRLQLQVRGDARYTERIGRWIAASLRLRTLLLLMAGQASERRSPAGTL